MVEISLSSSVLALSDIVIIVMQSETYMEHDVCVPLYGSPMLSVFVPELLDAQCNDLGANLGNGTA